ncbi:MAG: hypothetical protein JWP00_3560 [Chloroflexi bacterium]|nr:hypothetical protein [Chloroflexota bacterium]
MREVKAELVINRSVEDVFNFLAVNFLDALPRLDPMVLEIEQIPAGKVGKGTKFRVNSANYGVGPDISENLSLKNLDLSQIEPDLSKGTDDGILEVTEFETNVLFEIKGLGAGYKGIEKYSFKNVSGFTKVIYQAGFELDKNNLKILKYIPNWYIDFWAKKGVKSKLSKLKSLIETE